MNILRRRHRGNGKPCACGYSCPMCAKGRHYMCKAGECEARD